MAKEESRHVADIFKCFNTAVLRNQGCCFLLPSLQREIWNDIVNIRRYKIMGTGRKIHRGQIRVFIKNRHIAHIKVYRNEV